MSHPFDYRIGSEHLDDYGTVRVLAEVSAGKRGENFVIPGLEGELSFPHKLHLPLNLAIEVTARHTDPSGTITHLDGEPGHIYENVAKFKELFGGAGNLVALTRDAPHQGTNVLEFEVLAEPSMGEIRRRFVYLCHAPGVFWRNEDTETYSGGTGNITRLGNAPVHDAILTFGGNGSIVNSEGRGVQVVGASGGGIVVDCGRRTILQGGNPRDTWIRPMNNEWFRMDTTTVAVVVTGSVSVEWYPKWR